MARMQAFGYDFLVHFHGETAALQGEMLDQGAYGGAFVQVVAITFENDIQKALQFANALAALKHSIPGDLSWITRTEVEKLLASPRSLRISR